MCDSGICRVQTGMGKADLLRVTFTGANGGMALGRCVFKLLASSPTGWTNKGGKS